MQQKTYLAHSAKGDTWSQHKYIAIKNGRYIYPEDVKNGNNRSLQPINQVSPRRPINTNPSRWNNKGISRPIYEQDRMATKPTTITPNQRYQIMRQNQANNDAHRREVEEYQKKLHTKINNKNQNEAHRKEVERSLQETNRKVAEEKGKNFIEKFFDSIKNKFNEWLDKPSGEKENVTKIAKTVKSVEEQKFNKSETELKDYDVKDAIGKINDKYKDMLNCTFCTFASDYLMRNKDRELNINVDAAERGLGTLEIEDFYRDKDGNVRHVTSSGLTHPIDIETDDFNRDPSFWFNYEPRQTAEKYVNEISRQGNGARGFINVVWMGENDYGDYYPGGGHAMMYVVEDNKVKIIDAQINKTYDASEFFKNQFDTGRTEDGMELPIYPHFESYLRTDDLVPNYKNKRLAQMIGVSPEKERSKNTMIRERQGGTRYKYTTKTTSRDITNREKYQRRLLDTFGQRGRR